MQRNASTQLHGAGRPSHRQSGDFRGRRSLGANTETVVGVAQIPTSFPDDQARTNGVMSGAQQLDMARSPPNTTSKSNTKHVPCKFFRQGACQAGQACPFLHSTDATIETAPCKYFAKGNCKFGAKCALAHILPDGRRVNRPYGPMGMNMNGGALNIGGRVNPPAYQHQDSALANSLLTQQQYPADPFGGQYQYPQDELNFAQDYEGRYAAYPGEPGLNSNPGSKYGSPANESQLPISGLEHRLTALDAPLPASFDSNGISHIARYGAMAASVPSKFGMESPPPSSLSQRVAGQPLDAVRALRSSAFPSNLRNSSQLSSSPPPVNIEEAVSQRKMHSQQNVQRPRLLSASVPRPGVNDDWDDGFPLEEDYLPTNLRDDVLTPQEKMRRLSRPEQDFVGFKSATQGGLGIPSGNSSKVGSPLASSPSRYSALFAKQRQESNTAGTGFGHVGSPLRESHIQHAADTSPFGDGITARPSSSSRSRSGLAGDQSPFFSSPPRDCGSSFGMNMISSQLQRTHLNTRNETPDAHTNSRLQPPSALNAGTRHVSAPVVSGIVGGGGASRFDRTISSPRISSTRITEEKQGEGVEGDLVFSMDDDGSRRNSSLWGNSRSPVISPLGEARNGIGLGGGSVSGGVAGGGGSQKKGGGVGGGKGSVNAGLENIYTGRT